MRKSIPHPSVTGMASGLAIAAYLNQGKETTTQTGIAGVGQVATMGEGVIKDVTDGELGKAFDTLSTNAINMIASDAGRKTLVTASGVALVGAFARKQFPQLKLGGSKFILDYKQDVSHNHHENLRQHSTDKPFFSDGQYELQLIRKYPNTTGIQ